MKRVAKWLLVTWLLGEFYARGGRELLFGESDPELPGVQDAFSWWVELPRALHWDELSDVVGWQVKDRGGTLVGQVVEVDPEFESKDLGGYPKIISRVRVLADRSHLGYPIHVALSQLEDYTRSSLGLT